MHKKVVIIGSGISGLSFAWYLQKKYEGQVEVHLLEKAERPGGYFFTEKRDGFLFETGPRTFKASRSADFLELIEDIGFSDQIVTSEEASRYIYYRGKLELLPKNPLHFFTSPLTRKSIFPMLRESFIPRGDQEDESIADFITRRFNRETAHLLFDPLTLGVYAGDIEKLSMKSCFPQLFHWEKEKGSITKGILSSAKKKSPKGLFSFLGGNFRFIEALTQKLNAKIEYRAEVTGVRKIGSEIEVITSKKPYRADAVFLATPPKATAKILSSFGIFPFLAEMPTVTLAAISMGFRKKLLKKKGFGYLIPRSEKEKVLGAVWDSEIFPQKNSFPEETVITVMIRGDRNREEYLLDAQDAVKRHLHIAETPDALCIHIAKEGIPQFEVGYDKKRETFEKKLHEILPQVHILGNYLEGISVNACIERSKRVAEKYSIEL